MSRYMNVVLFVLVYGIFFYCVSSAPLASRQDLAKGVAFLFNYGYLNPSNPDDASGANDENSATLINAVANLQKFANLTVTGKFDAKTLDLVKTPRCGTRDPVEKLNNTRDTLGKPKIGNYYLQGTYWKKKHLTYRFKRLTLDLPEHTQIRILRKMISKWAEASTLTITEDNSRKPDEDVDILISFVTGRHGDPYAFDGKGGTLAHAYYPHNNDGLSGDAHFDDDEHFTTGTTNGINLDWVAVHEFGHSMGLEHSNVRESIMYPWYKGYFENIELTYDDIRGIQALYGKPETTPPPPSPSPPSPSPSPTAPASTVRPEDHDECQSNIVYDAIVMDANDNTHFIKGQLVLTLDRNLRGKTRRRVRDCWPSVQTPVDAAYLNHQRNVVIFKGSKYWEYDGNMGCPMRLLRSGHILNYGLPSELENMDAVFTWEKNKRLYFFKGNQYWRYNDQTRKTDAKYPRTINDAWVKFPKVIDAAVTWRNKWSYIFSAGEYYKVGRSVDSLGQVHVVSSYPRELAVGWMKCQSKAIGAIRSEPDSGELYP